MIKATKLTEKSWILSRKRSRCGLMRQNNEGYTIMGGSFAGTYTNISDIEKESGEKIKFIEPKIKEDKEPIFLDEYPVKADEVFDVSTEQGFPTYTKREGSLDIYAAGYWCIKFKDSWHGHFCPRTKTLKENEHIGPLKTKLEMDHTLRIENSR